jgi:hypothetical protein
MRLSLPWNPGHDGALKANEVLHQTHHLCENPSMGRRADLCKDTDDEARFPCAGGTGILREEVWVDGEGKVVQYNLAFLMPHLSAVDNGRILGFDNAHGIHERHFMGEVSPVEFKSYSAAARSFYREVVALRKSYQEKP